MESRSNVFSDGDPTVFCSVSGGKSPPDWRLKKPLCIAHWPNVSSGGIPTAFDSISGSFAHCVNPQLSSLSFRECLRQSCATLSYIPKMGSLGSIH